MCKFKVGDRIRIRADLEPDTRVERLYCNKDMASWGGQLDTIKSVAQSAASGVYYWLEQHDYAWTDAMLEPVEIPKLPLEKLTIVSNGTMTWAVHRSPDGSVKKSRILREQGMERDFGRDAKRAAQKAGVKIEAKGANEYYVDIDMGKLYDALRPCITVKAKGEKSNG